MRKYYISILGRCGKNESEIDLAREACMKVSQKYGAKFQGIMRDITIKDITPFSTTFIIECYEEKFTDICSAFVEELEDKIYISSVQSGNI